MFLPQGKGLGLTENEELLGVTVSQIRDFSPKLLDNIELAVQVRGLYMLTFALLWSVISLIPIGREKNGLGTQCWA